LGARPRLPSSFRFMEKEKSPIDAIVMRSLVLGKLGFGRASPLGVRGVVVVLGFRIVMEVRSIRSRAYERHPAESLGASGGG
jgi:hypothetical protein